MLPRHSIPTPAWRLAAVLLVSLAMAGPSVPTLARPAVRNDSPASATSGPDQARLAAAYGQLPLSFEANQGQADLAVDFAAHGHGYTLLLSAGEATLSAHQSTPAPVLSSSPPPVTPQTPSMLRIQLVGANPHPQVIGQEPLPGTVNYFIGSDPSQWHTGIPTYARVQYQQVYPGIDLSYYGNQGQLEDDFVLAPGADPRLIRLAFDGAEQVRLEDTGALLVQVAGAQLRQAAPLLYQEGPQGRQAVGGGFRVDESGGVGFVVGAYDPFRPLIIDPVLVYSTYLGGNDDDSASGLALDLAGNAYITGTTSSANFPTTPSSFRAGFLNTGCSPWCSDAFVSKLNATGTALIYSTFIGEAGAAGIAVDTAGNAYIAGSTSSPSFPTTPGAFQRTPRANPTAFVTKLNPTGTALVYSTLLGGTFLDLASALRVDATGAVYVVGNTQSRDFPTTPGAFQRVFGGAEQTIFVSKLNANGTALVYSTYLGGDTLDNAFAITTDAAGNAYVTGETASDNFPITPGAFEQTLPSSATHGFVSKLNPTGAALVYSTFLAGRVNDAGMGIAVNAAGAAYIAGTTRSPDFPVTPGAFQTIFRGSGPFLSKLNPAGTALVFSTFLSGSSDADEGEDVALDTVGHAFITGVTFSTDFPTTVGAFQRTLGDATPPPVAAFVTEFAPDGSALVASTLLGGTRPASQGRAAHTGARRIALDAADDAVIVGSTTATNLPTTPGAFRRTFGGGGDLGQDAFIAKLSPAPPACEVVSLLAGPPSKLEVAVHADRGLASLSVIQTSNANVALPSFTPGSTGTFVAVATRITQSTKATFTLRATDQTGAATSCDPALVTVGREPGDSPVQVVQHLASGEGQVTITNGTPGVNHVRLLVNGHPFEVADLHDGQTQTLDVSSAMRTGSDNTIVVIAHGPRGSSAVVLVSDS